MTIELSRRRFIRTAVGSTAAVAMFPTLWNSQRVLGANNRLNIGAIGVGGRGWADLQGVASENIVAVCDVDSNRLGRAASDFPQAKKYVDYRKLLDNQELDAVVIATPDHHHAPATVRALQRGLHVYCEKPLTHTVREACIVAELAKKQGVATQMGTQNHEHPGYLRLVELLQSGAIGPVSDVHVITDRPGKVWPQGLSKPTQTPPVPENLDWDLWLGPASERPYSPAYVPFKWRGWWDFGCGAVGDMAIHLMDPAFWALKLGGKVKVTSKGPPVLPDCGPIWMQSTFEFEPRGNLPACRVHWYEGAVTPATEIAAELPMNGSLFIGSKGRIAIQHGKFPILLPKEEFEGFKPPEPYLPDSPGHHLQWINACKTGGETGSNFSYAGPFTETVLLGSVAYRTGQTIHWDPELMKITNVPEANHLLDKSYRPGWKV